MERRLEGARPLGAGSAAAGEHGAGTVAVLFWFATGNVVTCGYTSYYYPEAGSAIGTVAFLVGTLQQLLGIILQSGLFSVVVTRFQMAKADFFFSRNALLMTRFGIPHCCVRIGNRRCNMIFHPDVRMTLLARRDTPEGESFFTILPMEVVPPSTMAGSITVAHRIDAESPLAEALRLDGSLDEHHPFLASIAVVVTIVGTDNVYQSDVSAIHRYSTKDFIFGQRFADIMKMSEGVAIVDFAAFDDVVALREPRPAPSLAAATSPPPFDPSVSMAVCF